MAEAADREWATPDEIERARNLYCPPSSADPSIEIDDVAKVSVAEDGVWVQAWVWLCKND